jgi:hypothetical protein
MRIGKTLGVVTLWGAVCAGPARAGSIGDMCNWFVPIPAGSETANFSETFTLVLQGNVINQLNLTAIANDPLVNPFANVNQNYFKGAGTTSVTAMLDGNGNTDVVFTGSNPILSSYTFTYGTATNAEPHFGLVGIPASGTLTAQSAGSPLTILSGSWGITPLNVALPPQAINVPMLTLVAPPVTGTNIQYLTMFADVTTNGQTVGEWFEVPYSGQLPQLANYTDMGLTLSDVGFVIGPQIPLDELNFGTTSPPGFFGSPFTPLPLYDGVILGPGDGMGGVGGIITVSGLVPEPSSILTLTTGLLVSAGYLRRRGVLRWTVPTGKTV